MPHPQVASPRLRPIHLRMLVGALLAAVLVVVLVAVPVPAQAQTADPDAGRGPAVPVPDAEVPVGPGLDGPLPPRPADPNLPDPLFPSTPAPSEDGTAAPSDSTQQETSDFSALGTFDGKLFTRSGYDYAPSMIQSGSTQQFWWCAPGAAPNGHPGDAIYYRTYNTSTGAWGTVYRVLTATGTSSWDGNHVCDPEVVRGQFVRPDTGTTYAYAMYYTANRRQTGTCPNGTPKSDTENDIGIAYSNNGVNWVTTSQNPVIPSLAGTCVYGAGQASAFNRNGLDDLDVFHTDTNSGTGVYYRNTSNGTSFTTRTRVSTSGLASSNFSGAAFSYDKNTGNYVMATGDPREPGNVESSIIGVRRLARTSVIAGTGTWTAITGIGPTGTGYPLNFQPAFRRDIYGNILSGQSSFTLYFGVGTNDTSTWDLASARLP